jgi:superfamily II DNA/RNA helicase
VADAILACPHPIVVFAEWTEPLLLLQRLLVMTRGLGDGVISTFFGGLTSKKRAAIIQRFNAGKVRVLLATTGAGGRGINLVGGRRVLLLHEHLSAAIEKQALGRVTRPAAQGRDGKWWLWRATTTNDTATVENVYARQLKKWKVAQASSEEGSDEVERGSMAFAVPGLTLAEALEKQALALVEGKEKKKKGEKRKREQPSTDATLALPHPPLSLPLRPKPEVARPTCSSSSSSSSRSAHPPLSFSSGPWYSPIENQSQRPHVPVSRPSPAMKPPPRTFEAWKKQRLDRQEATASMRKLDQLLTRDILRKRKVPSPRLSPSETILRHREQQKKQVQQSNVIDLC